MKNLIIAGVLSLAAATTASAQDMFASMESTQDSRTVIVIDALTATEDGFVAVYDYHRNDIGQLLGMARVRAGANAETRVTLGHRLERDVIALLFAGDDISDTSTALDSVEIDFN